MTMTIKFARHRRRAIARRHRLPPISVLGLVCMILLVVPTVRADVRQIGNDNRWSEGVISSAAHHSLQLTGQKHLDREKPLQESQLNRVAVVGGGIGGISIAHFLLNDANRPNPNLSQVTIFEKEPQLGGRIHFTRIYDHGTTVNTAGYTFDEDDMLIEEIANLTSIRLQNWPHNGWNTESRNFLYWMSRVAGEKLPGCPVEESVDITWMELAGLLRWNVADASFWLRYLGYIRQAFTSSDSHSGLNLLERRNGCNRHTNPLLWAGSRAKAGQSLELRSRFAGSDTMNAKPQKELLWNQHDRIFTGLLGDLYDHEEVTSHLSSTVTRVTRFSNGTFGIYWTQNTQDGSQELHMELFDSVVIAAPFHHAALEIEPPLPWEPEKIAYTPIHVTSIISERLPDSLLLQPHGAQWRTSAAFLWPTHLHYQISGLNTTSLPFISIARDQAACYRCESPCDDLTRVISGDLFSDDDIAALFHEQHEHVTFPNQSCSIPQQAHPDLVQPKYDVRGEFALEGGAVNKSSGCVDRPTIAWVHRDYWPDGIPVIKQDGEHSDDSEWRELVPGMFYVNGFEGREGASVSRSIASARKVKDLLVARHGAAQF